MRIALTVLSLCLAAANAATACTSFLLEDGSDLYFVHSLNFGSIERLDGAVYINPRGQVKEGWSFAALFDAADQSQPELVWRSRYGSVTFSPLGREMPDGGLNEAGLYIWEMSFDTEYPEADGIPTLFQMQWMQYQLDNFASVAEVLDHLDRVTVDGWGWHYFVADAAGNAAIIDFPDGRPEVFTGEALPIPVCGNSYYPHVMRWLAEHEGHGGDLAHKREYHEIARFINGAKMWQAFDGQDPVQYGFDMLQAMSVNVIWSVVFDVTRGEAWFNTRTDRELRRFKFGAADFAPGAPTLRLDISTPQTGDVRKEFRPFDAGEDAALLPPVLGMLDIDPATHDDLTRKIMRRMSPAEPADPDVAGEWTGTLTVRADGQDREFALTLRLEPSVGKYAGSVECAAFEGAMTIRNVRWRGGLLRFVTETRETPETPETPEGADRLEFNLHRTADGIAGYAQTWDWDNRQRAKVRLKRAN